MTIRRIVESLLVVIKRIGKPKLYVWYRNDYGWDGVRIFREESSMVAFERVLDTAGHWHQRIDYAKYRQLWGYDDA
jgi:hypothetical protein